MMPIRRLFLLAGAWVLMLPLGLQAQSAQRFSLQGSGLLLNLIGDSFEGTDMGYGFEAQVRYTPSAWSLGVGFQYTSHGVEGIDDRATLIGGFFEPRYVFSTSSSSLFPYLSGRFYAVQYSSENTAAEVRTTSTGLAANGGGGVLIRLGGRMNADLGATFGYFSFGEFTFENLDTGIEGTGEGNNGSNLVARLGLTFGF
jgi:hypothetical protein